MSLATEQTLLELLNLLNIAEFYCWREKMDYLFIYLFAIDESMLRGSESVRILILLWDSSE